MNPPVSSWYSPKVEVRESETEGKGVHATERIEKGEIVFVKGGHLVCWEECKSLADELGDYYLQIEEDLFLSPKTEDEVQPCAIFVNHSCEPNVGPDGQVTFKAIEDIEKGEELCYDYAMTTAHPYTLECECGEDSCRGKVTGQDWEKKEIQQRYGDNFTAFILRKIKENELKQPR